LNTLKVSDRTARARESLTGGCRKLPAISFSRATAFVALAAFLAFAEAAAAPWPPDPKRRPDLARFRARVETALAQAHAQRANWGILVADRDTGETLYALNPDHFFTPASNAKVFTTALALATLGREYRFRTTLESPASLGSDGRLAGDLILAGRGDPDLSNRRFPYAGRAEREGPIEKVIAEMADAAVAKGLREVDGDIVADDTCFPYDPYPAGWSVGDLFFTFGAPVGAIVFNDNTVSIQVQAGVHAGDPATVTTEPSAALETFGYDITTGPADGKADFAVVRQPGPNFVLLRGTIPVGHSPISIDLAMPSPGETAARTLKQLLEDRGVRVTGRTRVQHAPPPENTAVGEPIIQSPLTRPSDPGTQVLAEHLSPTLLESVRFTNKTSNNLHAELFLRAVGRDKLGIGSTAAGLKVEEDFLRAAGIPDGDVVLSDGSGLARDDLVAPRAMVMLLRYAARQPWGQDFLSTLPVAGVDGTLDNRMKNTAASGLIEAKTGTVEHDHSLSGYATTLRGESLAFAIFCNNDSEHGPGPAATLDAIATAMVETFGNPRSASRKK